MSDSAPMNRSAAGRDEPPQAAVAASITPAAGQDAGAASPTSAADNAASPPAAAAVLPVLTIHERDISPAVCQRCARCCQIEIKLPNTDSRYRKFLRGVGMNLSPPVADGQDDCCDDPHEATLRLGPCMHLRSEETPGGPRYACALYGDSRRPELCEHFNCVSWAKVANLYNPRNELMACAQRAFEQARSDVALPVAAP